MRYQHRLASLLVILLLLLTACGTQPQIEVTEVETPAPSATEATVDAEEPVEAPAEGAEEEEPEPAATEEEEPEATVTEEVEQEAAPEEADEEVASEEEMDEEVVDVETNVMTLADVEGINSFRVIMEMTAEGEAFEEEGAPIPSLSIEAEFVQEPPAQHLILTSSDENVPFGNLEVIQVEDRVYTKLGEQWIQAPAESVPNINDFAFISAEDLGDLSELERIGEEEVNGRDTIHYRGDRELLATLGTGDEPFDVENIDEAQIDVWVDEEENFIVRMTLVAEGVGINEQAPEAAGSFQFRTEYSDFNEEFTIEAPEEDVAGIEELLGFDLELPEDAELGVVSVDFAQFTLPMAASEAQAFLVDAFEAAGLELDEEASNEEIGNLVFAGDGRTIMVLLAEDAGATTITLSAEQAE